MISGWNGCLLEEFLGVYFVPHFVGYGQKSHDGVVECCLSFLQRNLPTSWTGLLHKRRSTLGCFSQQMCQKRGKNCFWTSEFPMHCSRMKLQTLQARTRGSSSKDFLLHGWQQSPGRWSCFSRFRKSPILRQGHLSCGSSLTRRSCCIWPPKSQLQWASYERFQFLESSQHPFFFGHLGSVQLLLLHIVSVTLY